MLGRADVESSPRGSDLRRGYAAALRLVHTERRRHPKRIGRGGGVSIQREAVDELLSALCPRRGSWRDRRAGPR